MKKLLSIVLIMFLTASAYATDNASFGTITVTNSGVSLVGNVAITGNDTSAGDGFLPQQNGLQVIGATNMDTYIGLGGYTNRPAWFMQTYRNEGSSDPKNPEFLYWSNAQVMRDLMMLSEGGRWSLNKSSNIYDYHSEYLGNRTNGLNDLDFAGVNTYSRQRKYKVSIVSTGAVDTWTWSKSLNNGSTWSAQPVTNNCATTNMTLENGTQITFGSATGHRVTDAWQRTGFSQLPAASAYVAPPAYAEVGIVTNYNNLSGWNDVTYEMAISGLTSAREVLTNTTSAIYCGRNIRMNSVYFTLSQAADGATLTFEYWNGSTWTTIPGFVDGTANFTQSGQVYWDKSTMTGWATNGISGKDSTYAMYWYRVRSTTTPTVAPSVLAIAPQGLIRFGVMAHHFDDDFAFYVDGVGAAYGTRFYQTDTATTFSANQLITDTRAQALIRAAQGTVYWPVTNLFNTATDTRGTALTPFATEFSFTNTTVTTGGGTNYGDLFAITNSTIGTTTLNAGTRYGFNNVVANAGNSSFEKFQLIEWNKGYTNVLITSGNSLQLPNAIGTLSEISLSVTLPTNMTVASTNYLVFRPLLIAGQAGSWRRYYGAANNSYLTIGSVTTPSGSGVTKAIAGNGITLSPTNGLGEVTVSLGAGDGSGLTNVPTGWQPRYADLNITNVDIGTDVAKATTVLTSTNMDGVTHPWDISSIVPVGTRQIEIHMYGSSVTGGVVFGFLSHTNASAMSRMICTTSGGNGTNAWDTTILFVPTNRIMYYYISANMGYLSGTIIGWTK